jgi:hypothetical protein
MAKKEEKKISIFGEAKVKSSGSKPKDDKEVVYIDGLESKLLELQFLKAQIADLEAQLVGVTDEIKTISKEKFVELYQTNKSNPNTFLIKDGEGCVMVIPTDRYVSVKDRDRANQLIEEYGEDVISMEYYFNSKVLERNMSAIEKLIMDAKTISDDDKRNLLVKEVKYSISKGYIDKLAVYGNKIETVIDDIQPIITLKNCGGKMEEGGELGSDFIATIYENGGGVNNIESKRERVIDYYLNNEDLESFVEYYGVSEEVVENGGQELINAIISYHNLDKDENVIEKFNDLGLEEIDNDDDGELYYTKDYFEYVDWSGEGDNDGYMYGINLLDDNGDVIDAEWFKSESERRNYILENNLFEYRFEKGGFLGGIFGGKRTYKKGLAYKLDRAKHNKSEDWEVPMKNRKKRYENGGSLSRDIYKTGDKVVYDFNGRYYKQGEIDSRIDENNYLIITKDGDKIKMSRKYFDLAPSSIDQYAKVGYYANGGGVGEYKYGVFTVSEDGEELGHVFYSENADLEFDPYGDDVPVAIGSNQIIRKLDDEYANGGRVGFKIGDNVSTTKFDNGKVVNVYTFNKDEIINGKNLKKGETLYEVKNLELGNSDSYVFFENDLKKKFGGNEISKEKLESMVGRKLNRWNDDKVVYMGTTYEKCYLRPYYIKK